MSDVTDFDEAVAEVRQLGGFETLVPGDSFVTDENIGSRLNANMRKVYLALVRARGANYFRKTVDFATVAGQTEYAFATILPANDFFELISMSRPVGDKFVPLVDFSEGERHDFNEWPLAVAGDPVRFALRPSGIEIQPAPTSADSLRINYVPKWVALRTSVEATIEEDTDTPADPVSGLDGYHEWAIWETVAELQDKDMRDSSLAMAKARWWELEVESMARQRNAGTPKRVNRVRTRRRFGET